MASSVVGPAAKQLGALLVAEGKKLYEVSDNIKRLQNELEWMQCFLEDAENRQHKEKVVRKWVAEIRDFAYEAEDRIERYIHEISYPRRKGIWNTIKWSCCVWGGALTLHSIGSQIDDLRTRISQMNSKLQVYGVQIIKQSDSLAYNSIKEQRRTYPHMEEVPVGLKQAIEDVVRYLINIDGPKVVGISGTGGLGKTTLAKNVYKEVQYHFERFAWVYISKEFVPSDVFREILSKLGKTGENPEVICKVLQEEKCLVVLDDVWETSDWEILRSAFSPSFNNGSKILITTRTSGLVSHADSLGYLQYSLDILNDEDSWNLLQKKAFLEGDTSIGDSEKLKLEELGKEMLKTCQGLPLAIVALGGILASRRTVEEWQAVLKGINSKLTKDRWRDRGIDKYWLVLELSYDELPYHLKPCFMYFICFPKDFEISAQRLYHLWEAEGIVVISEDETEESEGVSLDDIAKSYLNELVKRSMVQVEKTSENGEIRTCRLHDSMREVCLKKCEEVNFLTVIKYDERFKKLSHYTTRKLRRCIFDLGDCAIAESPFAEGLDETPCIRSLLVFSRGAGNVGMLLSEKVGEFWSLLRVLDLEGNSHDSVPEIIGDLIHLRYLSLRRTGASGLLTCIQKCKYLETLDLRTGGTLILSNELQKIERLRHLYLPSSMELLDPEQRLTFSDDQLRQMETLKNFDIENCKTEVLKEMTNLRKFCLVKSKQLKEEDVLGHILTLPKMCFGNQLHLNVRADVINKKPEILINLGSVKVSIQMVGRIELSSGNSYDQIFVKNLKVLYLESCEISQEGISTLERLPNLKELRLKRKAIMDRRMSFSNGGFPQLAKLHFRELDLEAWEVARGALPNLRYLFIFLCRSLRKIPMDLPTSVSIYCRDRVDGMARYKTCPYPEELSDEIW